MRITAAVVLVCALAASVHAQPEPRPLAQADEKTRAIVDKVVVAFGGAERIDRLRSFAVTVKMTGPPSEKGTPKNGSLTLVMLFPDSVYTKINLGETHMIIVSTPDHSFVTMPNFPVGAGMRLKSHEREEFLDPLFSEPIFVLVRRRHASVAFAYSGRRTLNGREMEMLEVVSGNRRATWAVDAETGRLVAGIEAGAVTEFSNWKNVKGIYIAAKEVTRKAGVKEPTISIITAADADMPVDRSLFKPPTSWVMRGE